MFGKLQNEIFPDWYASFLAITKCRESGQTFQLFCFVFMNKCVYKACFKRRASHVPNALETIDNEALQLIIYCFFNAFGTWETRRLKQASNTLFKKLLLNASKKKSKMLKPKWSICVFASANYSNYCLIHSNLIGQAQDKNLHYI
jgi:hypothetical protein